MDVKKELNKPLDQSLIKKRKQGGGSVSYVDAYTVIDRANKVFDFDWSSEVLRLEEVSRTTYMKGADNRTGNKGYEMQDVCYIAIVRIHAMGQFKDGCGAGRGISRNISDAIESALKEAETDAKKRALKDFGYSLGLALYDKEGANIGRLEAEAAPVAQQGYQLINPMDGEVYTFPRASMWLKTMGEYLSDIRQDVRQVWQLNRDVLSEISKSDAAQTPQAKAEIQRVVDKYKQLVGQS